MKYYFSYIALTLCLCLAACSADEEDCYNILGIKGPVTPEEQKLSQELCGNWYTFRYTWDYSNNDIENYMTINEDGKASWNWRYGGYFLFDYKQKVVFNTDYYYSGSFPTDEYHNILLWDKDVLLIADCDGKNGSGDNDPDYIYYALFFKSVLTKDLSGMEHDPAIMATWKGRLCCSKASSFRDGTITFNSDGTYETIKVHSSPYLPYSSTGNWFTCNGYVFISRYCYKYDIVDGKMTFGKSEVLKETTN